MSYVKQNFVDGQTLTAAQLNHMEAGIANAAGTQGEKGDKGEKGDPGPAGAKGDPGEGFTANAKALLLNLFENAAYKTTLTQDLDCLLEVAVSLGQSLLALHHAAVGLLAQFHNVLCRNSHFGILPYTVFVGL